MFKKLLLFSVFLCLIVGQAYADWQMNPFTNKLDYYTSDADSMEGVDFGTMTDGNVCRYDQTGTEVDCNLTTDGTGDCASGAICLGDHTHSTLYQPLEATLTDIADGTIEENLVNTANPWADNEVADDITIDITTDPAPGLGGNLDLNTHEITIKGVSTIPIGYMIDGTVAPAALATLTSTNTVNTRAFDGAANEDVDFAWQVPFDFTGSTFTARVIGYVSNATAPANGEVIAFSFTCLSIANSEVLTTATSGAQTSSLTADATYVQYDRLATAFSSAITPAGSIAAGETLHCDLTRLATTTDTYAQDFDVAFIEIKYPRALTND